MPENSGEQLLDRRRCRQEVNDRTHRRSSKRGVCLCGHIREAINDLLATNINEQVMSMEEIRS